jgi:hypothetical protein
MIQGIHFQPIIADQAIQPHLIQADQANQANQASHQNLRSLTRASQKNQ